MKGSSVNSFVALFRGINVGGINRPPMKELTTLLEELGLKAIDPILRLFPSRQSFCNELLNHVPRLASPLRAGHVVYVCHSVI
ncbi:DUF1697 domain-containing protein [Gimesia sp.]|uniref:DUF1697 domain-containing protein n=1 Tax=Gimesia sp. TaxID=2024833 RepID=UPI003A904055